MRDVAMIEKYGTPIATSTTSATHSHAPICPAIDSFVRAGRLLASSLTSSVIFL